MVIKNGFVALQGEDKLKKISIIVEDGKIKELTDKPPLDVEVIDAEGLCVLPGGIDAHVHFNTPGYEIREDFYHGSSFAASGGITTVIDMPCTSIPPVTSPANLRTKLEVVKKQAIVDYMFFGGLNGKYLGNFRDRMRELAPWVAGFKCYLTSGMDSFGSVSYDELKHILEMSKELDLPILLHAEDESFIKRAEAEQRRSGSKVDNYYLSRAEAAEIIAVKQAVRLAEETGGHLHIVHISTGEAAEIAFAGGVSVETCPHYLAFDLEDFRKKGSVLKVAPVIKREERNKLWSLLAEGKIDFVTSDHAASRREDKATGSIWNDYSGIAGSGMLLPYLFSEGYLKGRIGLKRLLEIICEKPAERYGIARSKGRIARGYDADLVLIDAGKEYPIKGADFLSKGRMTPFEGEIFKGKIMKTIRRGEVIYDSDIGITTEAGSGSMIRF